MNTSLPQRVETNELESKTTVLMVPDGCGGVREVKLSAKQQAALEWLMVDWNLTKAAEFAGVRRQTVSDWVNWDEDFKAVISAWRDEVRTMNHLKLVGATDAAVATVLAAIRERGDVRAAMALLKNLGMFRRECDCEPRLPEKMG